MPQDLRIRVGTIEATIPLGGTPAQVSAVLTRYAESQGIPITGTPAENLTGVLKSIREDVRNKSREKNRSTLEAIQRDIIEAKLAAEDDILIPPPPP